MTSPPSGFPLKRTPPNADVRMKGFSQRTTVEAAQAWIDSVLPSIESLSTSSLATEVVDLWNALDRVVVHDVISSVPVPAFARSMMDGFALRGEATHGATPYNPLSLTVIGTCLPGQPFSRIVSAGEAVRIMTGAPLADGTDAVLPVEQSDLDQSRPGVELLRVLEPVSVGKHVGQIGEDLRQGDVVVPAGRRLRPQDLGVLSSIGVGHVTVLRRPRVRIVITGNELLPAGTMPSGFQIADANGPMLAALVRRDGGEPLTSPILRDDPAAIRAALFADADVILVSGGSSVGQEDFVPKLLAEEGELAIHGVAMRPSSPAGMGRLGDRLVFLLPGNPVSCLCAYDFFAGRAIRALGGRSTEWPHRRIMARLTRKLVSVVGRLDYARVTVSKTEAGFVAEPIAVSGASVLSSTTRADGFVIVPPDSEGAPSDAEVEVFLYG